VKKMPKIKINIVKILEDMIEPELDIEVSTDEALAVIKQNFIENIESGAPTALIEEQLLAIKKTVAEIHSIYAANVMKLK